MSMRSVLSSYKDKKENAEKVLACRDHNAFLMLSNTEKVYVHHWGQMYCIEHLNTPPQWLGFNLEEKNPD